MTASPPLPSLPFRTVDALASGVGPRRLRSARLYAPVPGVRMDPVLRDDLRAVCRAVALALPDGAAFSHVTAARLWGLPVSRVAERDDRLHVTGPGRLRPLRSPRIVPHEGLVPQDVRRRAGLPVTAPARTWLDHAGVLTPSSLDDRGADRRGVDPVHEEQVVVTDALLADDGLREVPRHGVVPADLEATLADAVGRRGVRGLRVALAAAERFVDSPPETRVRLGLRAAGFPPAVVGADVFTTHGAWVGRPDLCWPERGVAVDYDGAPHVTRRKLASDVARRDSYERAGWHQVVLFAEDLTLRWHVTCRRVAEALDAPARAGGPVRVSWSASGRPRLVVRPPS